MPNWKKVIVSGSDASLNDITIAGDLTLGGYSVQSSGKLQVNNAAIGVIGGTYASSTYAGAVVDYIVYDAGRNNQRTGTVLVSVNTSNVIVHSENITIDIGATDGMIITTTSSSGNWRVNMENNFGATIFVSYNIRLIKV